MTDQQQATGAVPAQPTPPAPGPWADYLAAAQQLDAVRRAAYGYRERQRRDEVGDDDGESGGDDGKAGGTSS